VKRAGVDRGRRYWLFKSEPSAYSFADLQREQRTRWDGVRNYQARNLLRSEVQVGDGVLFYHSSEEPMAVVGVARVVRAGYPDPTAFDAKDDHFDPDSDPAEPTWFAVDVAPAAAFRAPVTRAMLKGAPGLSGMMVLARGSRLSVQPVTAAEWLEVLALGGVDVAW
jgi:predicted RNA-binding protein with PUA-like domain